MSYKTEPAGDDNSMERVLCGECGVELGYQIKGAQWGDQGDSVWRHSRCPVRIARAWNYDRDEIEELSNLLSGSIAASYPEVGGLGPGPQNQAFSKLRGDIAAGALMERLELAGYKIVRKA